MFNFCLKLKIPGVNYKTVIKKTWKEKRFSSEQTSAFLHISLQVSSQTVGEKTQKETGTEVTFSNKQDFRQLNL